MRINTHFTSAIMPNDNHRGASYCLSMKKRQINMDVINAQQSEIMAICTYYNIRTSILAKKAGVVPSTINRWIKSPSHALSAITMESIRKAWPIATDNEKQNETPEIEAGLMASIQLIFAILTTKKIINAADLENALIHLMGVFRRKNQPSAIQVMERLIGSLHPSPHESEIQAIRKLL